MIVTGAGSGIGRVMALRFAGEGAKVAVVDWLGDKAGAVTAEIAKAGGEAVAIVHGLERYVTPEDGRASCRERV